MGEEKGKKLKDSDIDKLLLKAMRSGIGSLTDEEKENIRKFKPEELSKFYSKEKEKMGEEKIKTFRGPNSKGDQKRKQEQLKMEETYQVRDIEKLLFKAMESGIDALTDEEKESIKNVEPKEVWDSYKNTTYVLFSQIREVLGNPIKQDDENEKGRNSEYEK